MSSQNQRAVLLWLALLVAVWLLDGMLCRLIGFWTIAFGIPVSLLIYRGLRNLPQKELSLHIVFATTHGDDRVKAEQPYSYLVIGLADQYSGRAPVAICYFFSWQQLLLAAAQELKGVITQENMSTLWDMVVKARDFPSESALPPILITHPQLIEDLTEFFQPPVPTCAEDIDALGIEDGGERILH